MANNDEHAPADNADRPAREQGPWWFNTRHMRVEAADTPSPGKDLLGPYATREEAEHALDTVKERNEAWDKQD
jgi:hypothetical protein